MLLHIISYEFFFFNYMKKWRELYLIVGRTSCSRIFNYVALLHTPKYLSQVTSYSTLLPLFCSLFSWVQYSVTCLIIITLFTYYIYKVGVLMELTSTPVSVILDMLETTVKLIMMTAALLLAFMVSSVLCLYFF